MIWDSGLWKEELKGILKSFNSLKPDEEFFSDILFEKNCFFAAFIVTKLLNSHKLSDELKQERFKVGACKYSLNNDSGIKYQLDLRNHHKWHQYYDLKYPAKEIRSIKFISDQLRHSFVFAIDFDELSGNYSGFYFNSDKTKYKALFYIKLQEFCRLIQLVANDNVVSSQGRLNTNTGQWETIASQHLNKAFSRKT